MRIIRIGTRGSALALAQTAWVRQKLSELFPGARIEIIRIKTSGDRFQGAPLKAIAGKGIFVKEIEDALLRKDIDLAVHSMKDLPTEIPAGLAIAAIPEREDPRDVLVRPDGRRLEDLPDGSRIGTGSLRRRSQILGCRSGLSVVSIRGNIDTRLKRLDRGEIDALVLAAAGLKRIGREDRIAQYLPPEICLSAVGQGALGLETKAEDSLAKELAFLHHEATAAEVAAERAFLRRLGGGCMIPVGGRAWASGGQIRLLGVVGDPDGAKVVRGELSGSAAEAERLGEELGERLLEQGAEEVLAGARNERLFLHGSG